MCYMPDISTWPVARVHLSGVVITLKHVSELVRECGMLFSFISSAKRCSCYPWDKLWSVRKLVSLCSYRLAHLNLRNLYLMWILAESDSKQQSSHSLIGVLRTSEGHSCL